MGRPIVRHSIDSSLSSLSWLTRFQVCLEAEVLDTFGGDWRVTVDPEKGEIILEHPGDGRKVLVPLHPGLHVVTPIWAAQRMSDQLHLAAITRGLIKPPHGTAETDASPH